jgi:hypothetical protein
MCISPGLQSKMKRKCAKARRNKAVKAAYSAFLIVGPVASALFTPWGN